MKKINVVYVDDRIDKIISKHMVAWSEKSFKYNGNEIIKDYHEVRFDEEKGYEDLIKNEVVTSANIILIDNHLFEEWSASSRFSGQQFKVLFKKLLPYIEVIIISQDNRLRTENTVVKFSGTGESDAESYYTENLDPCLDEAIKEVLALEEIALTMQSSSVIDKFLQDSILYSMKGDVAYEGLKKTDIDKLILAFRELKNDFNE